MKLKNIYTVRILNPDVMSVIPKDKIGKPTWLVLLQKDISWSAYAVVPDITVTDKFDLDIIFDKDFRSTTEVNIGDIFDIDLSIIDKQIGVQKIEVIGIRMDRPINHLENKDR